MGHAVGWNDMMHPAGKAPATVYVTECSDQMRGWGLSAAAVAVGLLALLIPARAAAPCDEFFYLVQ